MLNTSSKHILCVWFYVLYGIIVMQTQLNVAEASCRDLWPTCSTVKRLCQTVTQVKTSCKKTCGFCTDVAVASCRDQWQTCSTVKNLCQTVSQVKIGCRKTCGLCTGSGRSFITGSGRSNPVASVQNVASKPVPSSYSYYGSEKGSTSVPDDVPAYTTKIYLNKNKFKRIDTSSFNHFTRLLEIWIYGNLISNVADNSFSNLNKLKRLSLASNKLTQIKAKMFTGLSSMEEFELMKNQIASIEAGSFAMMSKLKRLYLQDNKLKAIAKDVFPEGLFAKTGQDYSLVIDFIRNPWDCTRVQWLVELRPLKRLWDKGLFCYGEGVVDLTNGTSYGKL